MLFFTTAITALLLSSAVPSSPASSEHISYKDFKLLRVGGLRSEYLVSTVEILDHYGSVQLWTVPRVNGTSDMLVSRDRYADLVDYLNELTLTHEVLIEDLGELLEQERKNVAAEGTQPLNWEFYHHYNDIVNYFRNGKTFSGSLQEIPIGKTVLGKDILLYKINSNRDGGENNASRPAIWIDGGIHGREWISVSTVTYIMDKVLRREKNNLLQEFPYECDLLLDRFDLFFVPVVNVDGYEFTHHRDRLWTKNLSNDTWYKICRGIDLNSNFAARRPRSFEGRGVHLFSNFTARRPSFSSRSPEGRIGLGHDPCSDFHSGSEPFSEPETQAISSAIKQRKDSIKLYLSLHAYSQQWQLPFVDGANDNQEDYEQQVRLAKIGKSAMEETNGIRYGLLQSSASADTQGKSVDWAKGTVGIKYSYNLQLRDEGKFGYLLPAKQIRETGEETFRAICAMAEELSTASSSEIEK